MNIIIIIVIILLFLLLLLCKGYCYQCSTGNQNNTYHVSGSNDAISAISAISASSEINNPYFNHFVLNHSYGSTREDTPPKYTDIYTNSYASPNNNDNNDNNNDNNDDDNNDNNNNNNNNTDTSLPQYSDID